MAVASRPARLFDDEGPASSEPLPQPPSQIHFRTSAVFQQAPWGWFGEKKVKLKPASMFFLSFATQGSAQRQELLPWPVNLPKPGLAQEPLLPG